ncbi:MAG: GspH/FimT family pseudopilin [Chromatocurvus sp.]
MQRRSRAFSLVELLVVLFVVVLMTSLATLGLNSGSRDRKVESAVRGVMGMGGYALDEAQFSGRDYGLRLVHDAASDSWRTQWLERWPEGWRRPETARDVWTSRSLGEGVALELLLEGRSVALAGTDAEPDAPPIVFYASGETAPGELTFRERESGDLLWRLRWDLLGRFTLENAGGQVDDQ